MTIGRLIGGLLELPFRLLFGLATIGKPRRKRGTSRRKYRKVN